MLLCAETGVEKTKIKEFVVAYFTVNLGILLEKLKKTMKLTLIVN